MKVRERLAVRRQAVVDWAVALGGAFWLRWGVCALVFCAALISGGTPFVMIGLGGAVGCIGAVMLDALADFRSGEGRFLPGNAAMALLAFAMANAAFYMPSSWTVVLGCLVSSGLLLTLLLRRLDRVTGMNIQVGMWLCGVAAALLFGFLYSGPYAGWVLSVVFLLAVALYVRLLVVLREGTETGLKAVWFLALGVGVAVLTAAAFNLLGVEPAAGPAFGGFVVGLVSCSLFAPLKAVTCWIACRLDEERKPDW